MPTLIFLCVANAARSQMAEGLARATAPPGWRVFSAGSHPGTRVSNRAIEVMKEIGIDISAHRAKGMDAVPLSEADLIVTLCAEEVCPIVPGVRKEHWPLPDPAAVPGTMDEQLRAFRETRDEIERRLTGLFRRSGSSGFGSGGLSPGP